MKYFPWLLLFLIVLTRINNILVTIPDGTKVRLEGKVASEPGYYEYYQLINLNGIRVYLDRFPQIDYGDFVAVEGEYEKRKLNNAKLIEHTPSTGVLENIRHRILDFYKSNFPADYAALVSGMAFGARSGLSENFRDSLIKTGTIHVVVASGANIALISSAMLGALTYFINRKKAIVFVYIFILIYIFLVGFDAPIIRAAIMGSAALSANLFGRIKSTLRILVLCFLFMLIIWPHWILDYSFWLSFGATASLVVFEKRINNLFRTVPGIIRSSFSTSFAAQILIAPMLIFMFGRFSWISPFVNSLVLWTVAPITIIGLLSGIISLVSQNLAKLVLFSSYPFVWWFESVVKLF